jgi:secreted Zn-dependent insulinase-like peptidase
MTEILQTPVKSPNDKNNYRLILLKNGLKALLIQHPKEVSADKAQKIAALALNIDVGGYDDGDVKGLAHFLEHIAFMGSTKYPTENEYHQFISNNGGDLNAATGFKETTYYFTIVDTELEGALDRFSSIFIDPLMSESAIEREIESMESEFQMRKNNDYIRWWQILYSMVEDGNPANVFIPGTLATLKNNNTRSNTELRNIVKAHGEKYYVAKRMTLAIESNRELDELQSLVEQYFNDIKEGEAREEIPQDLYKNIFKPHFYTDIMYMKPKTDKKYLNLVWPLPRQYNYYKCSPLDYIQRILNDQFTGGLNTYLKKKLLITNFSCSSESLFGDDPIASLLTIRVILTEFGSRNIEKILKAIYAYLLLLKETPMEKHRELYKSMQVIAQKKFDFMEALDPEGFVTTLVPFLKTYEDVDVLRAHRIFMEFDEDAIKMYIDLINQPNFNLSVMDYEAEHSYDNVEQYFGAEYKTEAMPESYKKLWSERTLLPELTLPLNNEFICTNFEILSSKLGLEGTVGYKI